MGSVLARGGSFLPEVVLPMASTSRESKMPLCEGGSTDLALSSGQGGGCSGAAQAPGQMLTIGDGDARAGGCHLPCHAGNHVRIVRSGAGAPLTCGL